MTRERAQSFLTDDHIQHIVTAYQAFGNADGFARVVGNDDIREKGGSLSIPLYVRAQTPNGTGIAAKKRSAYGNNSLKQAIVNWQESSMAFRESMDSLFEVLEQHTDHFRGGKEMVRDQFPDAGKVIVASGEKG